MKKILSCLVLFSVANVVAQEKHVFDEHRNLFKLNALALTTATISVQYERLITPKSSVGLSLNYMPKRSFPFLKNIESLIDDAFTYNQLRNSRVTSFSITPEYRFYLGKEAFKGFYIAPFVRYATHGADFPVTYYYQGQNESIVVDGSLNAFSGGIAFGAQWKLTDKIYLDWLIIGPMYGGGKGSLSGSRSLNDEEILEISKVLDDLDLPVVDYDYEVNSNGVRVGLRGPWAGIRASVGLGYKF